MTSENKTNWLRRLYLFWFLLHLVLFLISKEKASNSAVAEFWPIEDFSNLRYDYDYTELITYTLIVPLVLYALYKIVASRL
jgi:hypothetical protein